jgi:hypothetical protein
LHTDYWRKGNQACSLLPSNTERILTAVRKQVYRK